MSAPALNRNGGWLKRSQLWASYKQYINRERAKCPTHPPRNLELACRIATFNVHMESEYTNFAGEDEGRAAMTALLGEILPDVVCFQEVTARALNLCPDDFAFSHYQQQFGLFGNAICSKYPLKDLFARDYSAQCMDTRGLLGATMICPCGTEIRIYTTHLDVYDETEETRNLQVRHLHQMIRDDLRALNFTELVLLMGDFNALYRAKPIALESLDVRAHWDWIHQNDLARGMPVKTSAMEYLMEEVKWVDLFRGNTPPVTTWSMRRVDYILSQASSIAASAATLNTWVAFDAASDHLPLVVDVAFGASSL